MIRRSRQFDVYQRLENGTKLNDDWELIDSIDVTINYLNYNNARNDIAYKELTHIGLTYYKRLSNNEKYKLVDEDNEYLILHVNNETRMTQLNLQEVLAYE